MQGFSGVPVPHARPRLKVQLDDAPHDPGNLAHLWRRGPYSYKNPRGMRKLAQYNQLCLFYVGLSYAQKKWASLATKIDPHRLDQRNVDFEPRLSKRLTYLQGVFSCERKATAWCTALEAQDATLTTNPGWQEVHQKIVLLQEWINFLEQNQRWPELPQFCQSLSGYMPNHKPHEQSHALLSLWEREGEVKPTVDATVVFLQQVKANTVLPQVSRTFAASCLQMINYRLSKKPSRERLYIFLDMLKGILQPSFLPAEIWPVDSSLTTAIDTQCQQHLPLYRFHNMKISEQDLTYIKRFLGDIIRGKYVLKNQMGTAIAFAFSSWSEESSPTPEDTISAAEELAEALACTIQEVLEFARNAKGQRLLHFLQDQFNDALIACQEGAFADAGHTTTALFKHPTHGLLLRIESIGFIANLPGSESSLALPKKRFCPVCAIVDLKPGFLTPTVIGGAPTYSGGPKTPAFIDFMNKEPTDLHHLFALPVTVINGFVELIFDHFPKPEDEVLRTALIKGLNKEVVLIAFKHTDATTYLENTIDSLSAEDRRSIRLELRNILLAFHTYNLAFLHVVCPDVLLVHPAAGSFPTARLIASSMTPPPRQKIAGSPPKTASRVARPGRRLFSETQTLFDIAYSAKQWAYLQAFLTDVRAGKYYYKDHASVDRIFSSERYEADDEIVFTALSQRMGIPVISIVRFALLLRGTNPEYPVSRDLRRMAKDQGISSLVPLHAKRILGCNSRGEVFVRIILTGFSSPSNQLAQLILHAEVTPRDTEYEITHCGSRGFSSREYQEAVADEPLLPTTLFTMRSAKLHTALIDEIKEHHLEPTHQDFLIQLIAQHATHFFFLNGSMCESLYQPICESILDQAPYLADRLAERIREIFHAAMPGLDAFHPQSETTDDACSTGAVMSPLRTPLRTAPPRRHPVSETRPVAHHNLYKTPPRRPAGGGSPRHPATTGRLGNPCKQLSPAFYSARRASAERRRKRATTPGNSPGDS